MDQVNYEQITILENEIGDAKNYLIENLKVVILLYNERPVLCDVPKAVNIKVAQTDPGLNGDTVSGTTKPATLETGLVVKVPLHINIGDLLRVDTESGEYVERVNQK
jgi:elongation factor P